MALSKHMQAARTDANPHTAAPAHVGRAQSEVSTKRLPVAEPVGDPRKVRQAMLEGEPVFTVCRRFTVYRLAGGLMSVDRLRAADAHWLHLEPIGAREPSSQPEVLLAAFVPRVVDTRPLGVGQRSQGPSDLQFWQYPAATERQAFENHLNTELGSNVDKARRLVHTYLGLPWATYIDKQQVPEQVVRLCRSHIVGMAALATLLGYELRVHTVCQHIYWRRLVDTFCLVGISCLHLSHDEQTIDPGHEGWPFTVHSWPLFAPNIEVEDRRVGLCIGQPLENKRYLASFIGAHMPHYRSEARLRLAKAAQLGARSDILVEVGTQWHFEKLVYQEQAQHAAIARADTLRAAVDVQHYNEVLSNSVFSLCPEGAGPNTLRLWESLAVGAIPVVVHSGWRPPALGAPEGKSPLHECCVFWPIDQVSMLWNALDSIQPAQRTAMQARAISLYQHARQLTAWSPVPSSARYRQSLSSSVKS